jgi:hypothetical protein
MDHWKEQIFGKDKLFPMRQPFGNKIGHKMHHLLFHSEKHHLFDQFTPSPLDVLLIKFVCHVGMPEHVHVVIVMEAF